MTYYRLYYCLYNFEAINMIKTELEKPKFEMKLNYERKPVI